MNELIKKYIDLATRHEVLPSLGSLETTTEHFNEEKFAELIIDGCCEALEIEVDAWHQLETYQGSIKRRGVEAIKEHFGVDCYTQKDLDEAEKRGTELASKLRIE